jgi:1,4-dihydroxy-6-naphthoate synthase
MKQMVLAAEAVKPPRVRVAHSPDADDAFMFYGLAQDLVRTPGYLFDHILCDIQTLNEDAKDGRYELTAISYAAYPGLKDTYQLLSVGSSVGDNYGPMVLTRGDMSLTDVLAHPVAVPGDQTTATLALKLWAPSVQTVAMPFDAIVEAVQSGAVHAGLIIHEGQVTWPETGLKVHVDLGKWWRTLTGLPLPLGGNAIRRDLPLADRLAIGQILHQSVSFSLANRRPALLHAMQYAPTLTVEQADKFVGMYVNEMTLTLSPDIRQAVQLLFDMGYEQGIYAERHQADFLEI